MNKNSVHLESNYEEWNKLFVKEKDILKNIFNNDNYIIEHVGSTSIKGLLAKPIIDIAIGVDSFESFNKYLPELEIHYTIKHNVDKEEILLIKENESKTECLIHVLNSNGERFKNMILFRNILNSNNKVLKEYEQLKIELAKKYHDNRQKYTKAKNEFIQRIIIKEINKDFKQLVN